jgi:hypothetical protein
MPTFLGVRFPATEYVTGRTHMGRISSLGLNENGCLLAPGDDVQEKHLKLYAAFRRLKNFACVMPYWTSSWWC